MNSFNRRDFLMISTEALLALSGLLGLGGLLRFLGYAGEAEPPQVFDLGSAESYPLNSRTLVANGQYLLIRNAAGFTAINTICTHLGCRLNTDSTGFDCPCHGSRFDRDGNVLNGPAIEALQAQLVEPDADGHLIIQVG